MRTKLNGILTLLLAFVVHLSFAQDKTITGTVTDQYDVPLPGVNIIVKGTTNGTQTDFDGNYNITAAEGQTLSFTYIGQKTSEQLVGNSSTINIKMEENAEALEEVVLTALGLEKKKDADLSSTSIVKVDQLKKSGEAGVLQALAGKTSGVNITRNSGDPGAGAYIQIRGQNTILGDSSPLIVLDGAIISNTTTNLNTTGGVSEQSRLNDINPEDIKSISVLKGAAAAAVYGTSAANGVLVITTNRGATGGKKWSVNFKSSVSVDQINREWEKQDTFGQGRPNYWYGIDDTTNGFFFTGGGESYGDKISTRSGGADVFDTASTQYFVAENGTSYYPVLTKNSQETFNESNRNAVFQTGLALENSINFSFSGENSSTYVSFSGLDQQGIYKGVSDYNRKTVKLNNDTNFSDKLKFRLSTQYTNIKSNRVQTGSNLNGLYLGYLRTSPDYDLRDYKGTNFNEGVSTPNSHRSYRRHLGSFRTFDATTGAFQYTPPAYNNPLWTLNEQKNINTVNRFIIAPELNYKLTDKINLTARYSVDFYQDVRTNLFPAGSASDGANGLYQEDRITSNDQNFTFFANASHDLTDDINMSWVVGYQTFQKKYNRLSVEEANFTNPDELFFSVGNSTADNSLNFQNDEHTRTSGAYAVLNFSLYDQFLVELTARGEHVSTLPNAGLITYPSVSLGWDFTKYIENSNFINFGKIRASYGEVGIQPTAYATATVYEPAYVSSSWGDALEGSLYGNPLTRSTVRGNPDLKEERVKEFEYGFDTRFFNNRLSLSATYYDRVTEDVILELPTAPSNGFSSEYRNAAEIANKGIEVTLGATIIRTDDFSWNMNFNYTQNRSEVLDMAGSGYYSLNGFTSTSSGVAEGQPFGVLRGGVYDRDDSGAYILNDFGFPTAASDQEFVGDPNPDWRGGLGTALTYKGISISAQIETSQGNDAWNGTRGVLTYFGISTDTEVETVASQDLVNNDGVEIAAGTTFRGYEKDFGAGPVAVDVAWWTANGGGFGDVSEDFIEDASWTRLRELTLGYAIPSDMTKKIGLDAISFSITGRNLFLWTDIEGYDPDNNLTGASKGRGLEYFSNPGTKSFIGTLRLSF